MTFAALLQAEAVCQQMMIISLLGHHTLILSVCQQGRLLYLSQDVKFLNSMRIWRLTKPFFSHFIYVIPVVEIVNKLFNFLVRLSNQGDARVLYIVVGFVIYSQQNLSRTIYLPLLLLVQYMQSSVHKSCGQQVLNKPLLVLLLAIVGHLRIQALSYLTQVIFCSDQADSADLAY